MNQEDLLFIGDVHIGRRPTGFENQLEQLGCSAQSLSPEIALAKTVDFALRHSPRAVVFTGDLVENERDQFRGRFVLEREVKRLSGAGILVFAVAGNHDSQLLPKVVDAIDGCHLLGRDGKWECVPIEGPGYPIDLIGWSFPTRHFRTVPLDTGDFQVAKSLVRTGARTIGALHCDLGQTISSYAPVSRQRLDQAGLDAWLLGHVHMPGDLTGRNPVGYLGSLVGLDIGEPGPRGAWRVRADHQGVHCEQLALGPVRWERISIDLSTLETGDAQEFLTFIRSYLKERLANDPSLDPDMTHVVITRITLTGSPAHRECARQLAEEAKRELPLWPLAGFEVIVESIRDETRDRVDLVALANQPTPVGRVATTILDIQRDQATDLQERAQETIRRVADGGWETHEKDYPLPPANQALEDAAWRVLHHMLAQQETAS